MLNGHYAAAIPILRQAVAASSAQSRNYAYALYDLGRSLRLAGDPRAAISILERRMQIPIELSIVAPELAAARRAAGVAAPSAASQSGAGRGQHDGNGNNGNGNGNNGNGNGNNGNGNGDGKG